MKKIERLKSFKKWCDFAINGITKFDAVILLFSFVLGGLALDLDLHYFYICCEAIFDMLVLWYLMTFICYIIYFIIRKIYIKKGYLFI